MAEAFEWIFEPVGPMGGATGHAFVNTLQGPSPAVELAREAIQNSCDAAKEGERRVRVVFRIVNLEGADRQRFLADLQLERSFHERLSSLKVRRDNCLASTSQPLSLVFVEDYGTVGLRGDPHTRTSHFYRLLLSLGDTAKILEGARTGGSYGYGKSALSLNSRICTIVAYSSFEPDETGATARLMGCAYLQAHEFRGEQWTGRAWFGVPRSRNPLVVDPLRDEDAHQLAERLGFRPRRRGEHGTSILIVDSDLRDHRPLLTAIEDWWWPRLIDHELEVQVETAGETHYPQPKRRSDLLPFIECYSLAVGRAEPMGPHQRRDRFNRLRGLALGEYAFVLLSEDIVEEFPEDKVGCVALLRSPKMVVQYAPLGRSVPPTVGVFVAALDIDGILKLSEPPNHDRWDPNCERLNTAEGDAQTAKDVVRDVLKRLKDQMRKFQTQATPPKPREERRLQFLETQLATLLRPNLRDGDRREPESEPVEIRFREGPVQRPASSGEVETCAKVALKLRADAENDRLDAVVRVRVPVLKDDRGSEDELLPVTIECAQAEVPREASTEPEFRAALCKDEWLAFALRSGPYDAGWSVKVIVEVQPSEVRV
ncbi:hypothetical protein HRbin40_02096 [bacterium HR40]|nr:hypothetical protein HRbin40_02096 [bacterium HR40]